MCVFVCVCCANSSPYFQLESFPDERRGKHSKNFICMMWPGCTPSARHSSSSPLNSGKCMPMTAIGANVHKQAIRLMFFLRLPNHNVRLMHRTYYLWHQSARLHTSIAYLSDWPWPQRQPAQSRPAGRPTNHQYLHSMAIRYPSSNLCVFGRTCLPQNSSEKNHPMPSLSLLIVIPLPFYHDSIILQQQKQQRGMKTFFHFRQTPKIEPNGGQAKQACRHTRAQTEC